MIATAARRPPTAHDARARHRARRAGRHRPADAGGKRLRAVQRNAFDRAARRGLAGHIRRQLGEELGWRGYALPSLQSRFSPLSATLILALFWFLWHLPMFAVIATYRSFAPIGYVGMALGLTCGAVVLTWLYNRSGGSILLVAIWHGLYNLVSATEAVNGTLAAIVTALS